MSQGRGLVVLAALGVALALVVVAVRVSASLPPPYAAPAAPIRSVRLVVEPDAL